MGIAGFNRDMILGVLESAQRPQTQCADVCVQQKCERGGGETEKKPHMNDNGRVI